MGLPPLDNPLNVLIFSFSTVFAVLGFIGATGNAIVLIAFAKDRRIRRWGTSLIFCLAFIDFTICLWGFVWGLVYSTSYGEITVIKCMFTILGQSIGTIMSCITQLAIALQRLYAVWLPFSYHHSSSRYEKVAFGVLIAAYVLLWVGTFINNDFGKKVPFCTGAMVLTATYRRTQIMIGVISAGCTAACSLLVLVFQKCKKAAAAEANIGASLQTQKSAKEKMVDFYGYILLAYFCTIFIAQIATNLKDYVITDVFANTFAGLSTGPLYMINSIINVIIFSYKSMELRNVMRSVVFCLPPRIDVFMPPPNQNHVIHVISGHR